MTDRVMNVDGVELCLETFGDRRDDVVLLIGGAAASMDWWDTDFCTRLAAEGLLVVRYDHRDTGRSSSSPAGSPTYTAADLTADPVRILDGLGVDRAHLVGLSMGGGIAQQVAAQHPERVRALTLIATSPAGRRSSSGALPAMEPRLAAFFGSPLPEPAWDDPASVVDYLVANERPFAGTLGFDEDRIRGIATIVVARTRDIEASVKNHWLVVGADAADFQLSEIQAPTLVLHGTSDPLFPLPHGEALAAEIPGAALVELEGMGHEVPPPALWDTVVPAVAQQSSGTGSRQRDPGR